MKTFNDNQNRTWTVAVTVGSIKRVKDLLGVNLLEAVTGDLIEKLETDVILLVDILYILCKEEADAKSVTDVQFGESLSGDSLEFATDAFLGELIDFFPQAKRQIFRKAWSKQKEAEKIAMEKILMKIETVQTEKIIEEKLKSI